jgi:hypothetical protein
MSEYSIRSHQASLQNQYLDALAEVMTYCELIVNGQPQEKAQEFLDQIKPSLPLLKSFLDELRQVVTQIERNNQIGMIAHSNAIIEVAARLVDQKSGSCQEALRDIELLNRALDEVERFQTNGREILSFTEQLGLALETSLEEAVGAFRP